MKHKHAELIKAWADGAEIEYRYRTTSTLSGWSDWEDKYNDGWCEDDSHEYRIKPKQSVVRWKWAYKAHHQWCESEMFMTEDEIESRQKAFPVQAYFKLEYTRTEFPE